MEVPHDLERQITNVKWEDAQRYMEEHPDIKEFVVQHIPNEHLFKIIRTQENKIVRLHYDRICEVCRKFFLHQNGEHKLFTCQDCLNKK